MLLRGVPIQAIPTRFATSITDRIRSTSYPTHAVVMNAVISLSGRLDESRLRRAIRLSLDAEPGLGCRFVEHWFRPYWQRYENLDGLPLFEIRRSSGFEADVVSLAEASLDLPIRVNLFRGDSELLCVS